MKMKLELIPVPVVDIDRAKAFYVDQVGFVEDVDVRPADGVRFVQLTPPGSSCSIVLGANLSSITGMTPGSLLGVHLVVDDIAAVRDELVSRGVPVAQIRDIGGGVQFAEITDPDGNRLLLQEMAWRTGDTF